MKRYILVYILGALMLAAGQTVLCYSLHPEHLPSLRVLLQGSLGLILGSVVIAIGMLGLVEGYEKLSHRMRQLLGLSDLPSTKGLALRNSGDLARNERSFWRSYRLSNLGVCLFLFGILGLTFFSYSYSSLLFSISLGSGLALLGFLAIALVSKGLRGIRQTHQTLNDSTEALDIESALHGDRGSKQWTMFTRSSYFSRHFNTSRAAEAALKR